MVVLGRAVKHIAETLEDMTIAASQMGLTVSVSKTKYMIKKGKGEMNQKKLK
jgi:hypothetical protein